MKRARLLSLLLILCLLLSAASVPACAEDAESAGEEITASEPAEIEAPAPEEPSTPAPTATPEVTAAPQEKSAEQTAQPAPDPGIDVTEEPFGAIDSVTRDGGAITWPDAGDTPDMGYVLYYYYAFYDLEDEGNGGWVAGYLYPKADSGVWSCDLTEAVEAAETAAMGTLYYWIYAVLPNPGGSDYRASLAWQDAVTIHFVFPTYGTEGGRITVEGGRYYFFDGETVRLSVQENEGYRLASLEHKKGSGLSFTLTEDDDMLYIVTGQFAEISEWAALQEAIVSAENGSTVKLGEFAGEDKKISASPDDAALLVPEDKDIVLDLDGCELDRALQAAAENGCAITVEGKLTVTGDGKVTGAMNTGSGGAIVNNGELTIEGGAFTGNAAAEAGAVYNAPEASLTVKGGEFTGNEAQTCGGAIVSEGALTMTGGTIADNTAASGGGVYFKAGVFSVSGKPVIMNNAPDNVFLPQSLTVTVAGSLDPGAVIGVTSGSAPTGSESVVITNGLNGGTANVFVSDSGEYSIALSDNGEAVLRPGSESGSSSGESGESGGSDGESGGDSGGGSGSDGGSGRDGGSDGGSGRSGGSSRGNSGRSGSGNRDNSGRSGSGNRDNSGRSGSNSRGSGSGESDSDSRGGSSSRSRSSRNSDSEDESSSEPDEERASGEMEEAEVGASEEPEEFGESAASEETAASEEPADEASAEEAEAQVVLREAETTGAGQEAEERSGISGAGIAAICGAAILAAAGIIFAVVRKKKNLVG